jgi:hypothetical protein
MSQRAPTPKVCQSRLISPEAASLSRRLQDELGVSANRLAELAIYALAEAQERRREQSLAAE